MLKKKPKCQPIIWVSERTWGQIIEHEKEKILLDDLWNKILCALRGEPYKKDVAETLTQGITLSPDSRIADAIKKTSGAMQLH